MSVTYSFKALIILVFLIVWAPGFKAPYQFDDYTTPMQDPASQSVSSWGENFFKTLRPLTKLTYALESSLGLNEASERRIFQFFIASLCLLILFDLLWDKSQNIILTTGLTLLWGIHPIHGETFLSLSGRATLLSILFILASLRSKKNSTSLVFAMFSVLSKEVSIVFFLFRLQGSLKTKKVSKSFVAFLIFIILMGLLRFRLIDLVKFSWFEVPYYIHWWDGVASLSAELVFVFLPWKVSVDPDFLYLNSALWFFMSIGLLSGLLYFYIKTKNKNLKSTIILWFALAIPIHSFILKLDPLALRSISYTSIAYPFFALIFIENYLSLNKIFKALVIFPLIGILGYCSLNFSTSYQDPILLWSRAKENSPNKIRPVINLVFFLVRQDRYSEAKVILENARKRWPYSIRLKERLDSLDVLVENKKLLNDRK